MCQIVSLTILSSLSVCLNSFKQRNCKPTAPSRYCPWNFWMCWHELRFKKRELCEHICALIKGDILTKNQFLQVHDPSQPMGSPTSFARDSWRWPHHHPKPAGTLAKFLSCLKRGREAPPSDTSSGVPPTPRKKDQVEPTVVKWLISNWPQHDINITKKCWERKQKIRSSHQIRSSLADWSSRCMPEVSPVSMAWWTKRKWTLKIGGSFQSLWKKCSRNRWFYSWSSFWVETLLQPSLTGKIWFFSWATWELDHIQPLKETSRRTVENLRATYQLETRTTPSKKVWASMSTCQNII